MEEGDGGEGGLPDGEDLLEFGFFVGVSCDDDDAVEEVEGEAVGGDGLGAADLDVTSVGGHDNDWGEFVFEGSVDEREAFLVEHVNLVDEEHTRDNLGLAFFLPFADFDIDLVADFGADLASVAREEGEEALRAGVDHVDLVEGDGVNHFFSGLDLAVGGLDEFGFGSHGVVIAGAGVGAAELGDLARGFIDRDDVSGENLLLLKLLNELVSQVVDGFHVGGFDGEFSLLGAGGDGAVDLDLDDLTEYYFGLFFDSHADGFAERLGEGFGLGHFE